MLALAGLTRILATWRSDVSARRANPQQPTLGIHGYVALLLLWAALHLALYVVLGVTPYLWYYLPFVAVLSALAAVGLTTLACLLPDRRRWLRPLAFGLLLAAAASGLVRSHLLMQQQLRDYADLPITRSALGRAARRADTVLPRGRPVAGG